MVLFSCLYSAANAQIAVSGRVYDVTQLSSLSGVSVMSSSGKGTVTDTLGKYKLVLSEKDSIWFSYQGKSTPKYAVKSLNYPLAFDISLKVKSDMLPTVTVWNKSFRMDSLENRENYAKIFNFRKPGLSTSMAPPSSGNVGVGVDIGELVDVFKFRKNKRMLILQNRLIQDEQDKYLDYRFSKVVIRRLTKITNEDIDLFMRIYKPDYEFVISVNEAELGIYIQECYKDFVSGRNTPKEYIQLRIARYDF